MGGQERGKSVLPSPCNPVGGCGRSACALCIPVHTPVWVNFLHKFERLFIPGGFIRIYLHFFCKSLRLTLLLTQAPCPLPMLRVELRPHKMHTLKSLPPGPPDGVLVWRRAFTDDRVEMRSPRGVPSNVTRILTKSRDPERAASAGTTSRADQSFAAGSPGTPGAGREATADSSPARREGGWPSSQTPGLQNCGKINVCSGSLPRPTFPFPNCEVLFCVPSTRGAPGSRVVQACPVGSALERPSRDLGGPGSTGLDGRWGSGRPAPTAPPMAGVGGARRGNATPRRGRPRAESACVPEPRQNPAGPSQHPCQRAGSAVGVRHFVSMPGLQTHTIGLRVFWKEDDVLPFRPEELRGGAVHAANRTSSKCAT